MQIEWLIIDGYNVLYTQRNLVKLLKSNPQKAKANLIRIIEKYVVTISKKTTIIFDGKKNEKDPFLNSKFIEVIYSSSNLSADGLIERLVYSSNNPSKICVVTSDHLEQQTVSSSGANFQTSEDFMNRCNNKKIEYSSKIKSFEKPKLGDVFPNDE